MVLARYVSVGAAGMPRSPASVNTAPATAGSSTIRRLSTETYPGSCRTRRTMSRSSALSTCCNRAWSESCSLPPATSRLLTRPSSLSARWSVASGTNALGGVCWSGCKLNRPAPREGITAATRSRNVATTSLRRPSAVSRGTALGFSTRNSTASPAWAPSSRASASFRSTSSPAGGFGGPPSARPQNRSSTPSRFTWPALEPESACAALPRSRMAGTAFSNRAEPTNFRVECASMSAASCSRKNRPATSA